jgi:hypothetical protein
MPDLILGVATIQTFSEFPCLLTEADTHSSRVLSLRLNHRSTLPVCLQDGVNSDE